jgi:hypothetical protein
MKRRLVLAVAAAAVLTMCLVPDVSLDGKLCNDQYPCITGYTCVRPGPGTDGQCVNNATLDAGIDASSAASCAVSDGSWCSDGGYYVCNAGTPQETQDCSATGLVCDSARGCLPACGSGTQSAGFCQNLASVCLADSDCCSGAVCSLGICATPLDGGTTDAGATACAPGTDCLIPANECIATDACDSTHPCATKTLTCNSGICVFDPGTPPTLNVDGGVADFSCFGQIPPDPMGPTGYTGTAQLTVLLTTLSGQVLDGPAPAGTQIQVLAADAPGRPKVASGLLSTAPGPLSAVVSNFPTNTRVVFQVGIQGLIQDTEAYAYVPASLVTQSGGEFLVNNFIVAVADTASMGFLANSSDVPFDPGSGLAFGSVFDCGMPNPRRVGNVAVTSFVPGLPRYTDPNLFKIAPSATVTAPTGRFVLVNVPVTGSNEVIVTQHPTSFALDVIGPEFVPKAGVISIVDVRPPKT